MKATQIISQLYTGGEPICITGYWHVKWYLVGGGERVTSFGWKEKNRAERHIDIIVSGK